MLLIFFKILSFISFMVRCSFVIDLFFSSRILWIASKYNSYFKCTTKFGMRHSSFLIHLFFSSTLIVSLMIFCVILLSALVIILSTHNLKNHQTIWLDNHLTHLTLQPDHLTHPANQPSNSSRQTIWLVPTNSYLIIKIWKRNTRDIRKWNSISNYILIFAKLF